jgi:hypothetical protein
LLAVAPGGVLAVVGILTSAMRTINLNELTALRVSLLYSGASPSDQPVHPSARAE